MIEALRLAGFPGVEAEGEVIHARLWSSSVEFTAVAEVEGWRLSLQWPLRASEAQIDGWNTAHPEAPMEIYKGETRVSVLVSEGDPEALQRWSAIAELAVATCIQWRRAQRAPGEGM
ncbi:hypothetical protein ACSBLW_16740 [Thioclava sp. FR2]|uniref:hypothetical protein n=1 Tax=Thioclava sp. FR2 TaxID=3445780 RepID=UPI003EB7A970